MFLVPVNESQSLHMTQAEKHQRRRNIRQNRVWRLHLHWRIWRSTQRGWSSGQVVCPQPTCRNTLQNRSAACRPPERRHTFQTSQNSKITGTNFAFTQEKGNSIFTWPLFLPYFTSETKERVKNRAIRIQTCAPAFWPCRVLPLRELRRRAISQKFGLLFWKYDDDSVGWHSHPYF